MKLDRNRTGRVSPVRTDSASTYCLGTPLSPAPPPSEATSCAALLYMPPFSLATDRAEAAPLACAASKAAACWGVPSGRSRAAS